ncbi:MAG: glucosidase [Variovorax sp.]|nr:MAG: glucosidase [Variovorax sp.]
MADSLAPTEEEKRLCEARENQVPWRRFGPYVSERQWGTVREDYSAGGDAWESFSHDQARFRAYRWGEDGIAGISDDQQHLCFALALWNGTDPILKERMFGLTGNEGNHGEDVKEYYFYLDNLPSHAYMKYLYKYPQHAYPYEQLLAENRRRGRHDPEYELLDTGIFDENRYFDVFIEYAKDGPNDMLIRITVFNRGPDAAPLDLLPTLWFRNDWSWSGKTAKPLLARDPTQVHVIAATHVAMEPYWLYHEPPDDLLFTENESNRARLGGQRAVGFAKDAFDEFVVHQRVDAVNRADVGTKAAPLYRRMVQPGQSCVIKLCLSNDGKRGAALGSDFDALFARRIEEADAFYQRITPFDLSADMRNVQRQAFAGMLWSKQYYHFVVDHWLQGDKLQPPPPEQRKQGRNHEWTHLATGDVLSMPDKWEYPWFAAWDMAFHCVAFAMIDADFAKDQLLLLTREWYMHPNGQIPAYEWAFGDVNPPVHAWAAIRICQIEQKMTGRMDTVFLERIFRKLLINFTWWVNRKDQEGNNLFQGGFLGLDNIGAFDRTSGLPGGGHLEQADGTSWMATYCLNMLNVALVLAFENPTYEDVATKFFEHFVYIGDALNRVGGKSDGLWDDERGYYFDVLLLPDGRRFPVDAYTVAGLVPLFAIAVGDRDMLDSLGDYDRRYQWFADNRPELLGNLADMTHVGVHERTRLALVDSHKLARLLEIVLDETHLLSPHGIRSVSKTHAQNPCLLDIDGQTFTLDYEPAESTSGMFGGNSNWRGPVWFPLNFLLIEALQKHHYFLGDEFKVPEPARTGHSLTLWEVAADVSERLIKIFLRDTNGRRASNGRFEKFNSDPHWQDLLLFYEYFDGDSGAGLGASHQTGWTGLVAKLIHQHGEYAMKGKGSKVEEDQHSMFKPNA